MSTALSPDSSVIELGRSNAPAGQPVLPDDAPPPTRRREGIAAIVLPPIVLGAAIVAAWYFVSYVILDKSRRFLLEPPHQVWSKGFMNTEARNEMFDGLRSSGKVAFWGLLIAILLGFALAVLMSQSKLVERAVFPYSVVLQSMPILAIVPLIGFWFGYGFSSRVFVTVLISLFPIVVNTLFGLTSADQGMHDLLTLHGSGRLTRLFKIQFPAAQPAIFAGLRISAGLSVIGAIVGDFFFGQGEVGIGQLLKRYAGRLEGENLLTAVFLSAGMGVAVFMLFGWLNNRMVGKWATVSRGR
jgi:NitT/TauT family transport system permease protein